MFHTHKLYKQRQTWRNLQYTEKCLQKQRYNPNQSTLYVRWTGKLHTRKISEMSSKKKYPCYARVRSKNLNLVLTNQLACHKTLIRAKKHQNLGGDRLTDALKGPLEPNGSASSKESNRPKFRELFPVSNPDTFSPLELLMESNLEKRLS